MRCCWLAVLNYEYVLSSCLQAVTMGASPGWRLSLVLCLGLLFCGNCIILGGLAGLVHACRDIPDLSTGYVGVANNKAEWCGSHVASTFLLSS